ncbi:S-adenosyl-L-methionine-dependent methyltransferase [Rhypophila decipiens]
MSSHMPEGYGADRLRRYLAHFNRDRSALSSVDREAVAWATDEERLERQKKASEVTSDYYDLVTPLYEQGWGQQFHYTPLSPGLSIRESMVEYEVEFAHIARLRRHMRVLDLGCGIGGPARTIARKVGCQIVGITNSAWHVERGRSLTAELGLDNLITFVHGDFTKMPFPDECFDAAYSIESLCYSPDPAALYSEVKRVLKPGAPFTFHDFAMTEKFDETIAEHRKIRNCIEFGNGISKMPWVPEMRESVKQVGFELLDEENMAYRSSPAPWYYGPAGDVWWAWMTPGWADFWKVVKMSPAFLFMANVVYRVLVFLGKMPVEVLALMDTMWYCCRSVIAGGKMDIFTPMYVFVCRKPSRPIGAGAHGGRGDSRGTG